MRSPILFRYRVALQLFRGGLTLPSGVALAIEEKLSFAHCRIEHPDLGRIAVRDGSRGKLLAGISRGVIEEQGLGADVGPEGGTDSDVGQRKISSGRSLQCG